MKLGLLGIFCAVLFHAGILLFGGLLFGTGKKEGGTPQQVELLGDEPVETKKEEKKEDEQKEAEQMEAEEEEAPDPTELLRSLESPVLQAPSLDAASLGAIEAALDGQLGSGDFADSVSFASGGRIGGTGRAGGADVELENAFSLAEIDQKPRAIFQAAPLYPDEMRSKKAEGLVSVIFVVDPSGRVTNPRVEKASHPAFEKPALDAVRQWKFEPGLKAGQRVSCKMRVPFRFQPQT